MDIPHIVLFDEDKWQKSVLMLILGGFKGGGHFWRVTHVPVVNFDITPYTVHDLNIRATISHRV